MKAVKLDTQYEDKSVKTPLSLPKSYGPDSEIPHNIPVALRAFMLQSTNYMAQLSLFEQFIVWRYTIDSNPINMLLILGKVVNEAASFTWCHLLFLYWRNTVRAMGGAPVIEKSFVVFTRLFENPTAFRNGGSLAAQLVRPILVKYTALLQRIILGAPPVKEGFHVYKVASNYPGLPESPTDVPKVVPQRPFNSTTVNPHFNFAPFMGAQDEGNLFDLRIPMGAHILYVPAEFHAHPVQREIILPAGVSFDISYVYKGLLDVVDKESVQMIKLQDPLEGAIMGPLDDIKDYEPCLTGRCKVERKPFTIFLADYREE